MTSDEAIAALLAWDSRGYGLKADFNQAADALATVVSGIGQFRYSEAYQPTVHVNVSNGSWVVCVAGAPGSYRDFEGESLGDAVAAASEEIERKLSELQSKVDKAFAAIRAVQDA